MKYGIGIGAWLGILIIWLIGATVQPFTWGYTWFCTGITVGCLLSKVGRKITDRS